MILTFEELLNVKGLVEYRLQGLGDFRAKYENDSRMQDIADEMISRYVPLHRKLSDEIAAREFSRATNL